jgi:hypothetical protein
LVCFQRVGSARPTHAGPSYACELSFVGNINASEYRVRQKLNQLICLHHKGLEVLNNPVSPPSILCRCGRGGCTRRRCSPRWARRPLSHSHTHTQMTHQRVRSGVGCTLGYIVCSSLCARRISSSLPLSLSPSLPLSLSHTQMTHQRVCTCRCGRGASTRRRCSPRWARRPLPGRTTRKPPPPPPLR